MKQKRVKATAQPIIEPQPQVVETSLVSAVSELIKARLTALVLATTLVGFLVGSPASVAYLALLHVLVGTALLASGAATLNQWMERHHDARMVRTQDRPLPSGRLQPEFALMLGGALSCVGLLYLAFLVNPLTAVLGAATIGSYLFIYTPLKRKTTLNTVIGAIPGALPPLMGWTAATGSITSGGWSLFAILAFWQLPHFLAIGWMYRDDYAKAGFAMLPAVDPDGQKTGLQTVCHTLGLLPVSLFPFVLGLAGKLYFAGALVLGFIFLSCAIRFSRELTISSARRLFFASIIYLPLLLGLMVFDRIAS